MSELQTGVHYVVTVDETGVENGDPSLVVKPGWEQFEKERENLLIQQGYETGFLVDINRRFLRKNFQRNLEELEVLTVCDRKIKAIGGIQYCFKLKICTLHNNFISDIQPLVNCPNLVKIDLSGNQITDFPAPDFWGAFLRLKVLMLHDNGIGKLSCIQSLGLAPSLEYLTLYDTPVSIRPSYRHHVVNSIITLKVLDNFIIADEEVIEDANFGGKFAALSDPFYVDMSSYHNLKTGPANIEDESENISSLVRTTNKILSKHSPVLIIQKVIRGFFARKFKKYMIDNRIWVTSDKIREFSTAKLDEETPKAPKEEEAPEEIGKKAGKPTAHVRFEDSVDLTERSFISQDVTLQHEDTAVTLRPPRPPLPTPKEPAKSTASLLQAEEFIQTLKALPEEEKLKVEKMFRQFNPEDVRPFINQLIDPSSNYDWLAIASEAHQQRFKDPITKEKAKTKPKTSSAIKEDLDWEPQVEFRLRGFKLGLTYGEPYREHLMDKAEAGHLVRHMHSKYHEEKEEEEKLKKPLPRYDFTTLDQLIYGRTKGIMSLATFLAVDKAYKEKEREDQLQVKQEKVYEMKLARKKAKQKIAVEKHGKAKEFSSLQDYDAAVTRAMVKEREKYYQNTMEKYRENDERKMNNHYKRLDNYAFSKEFGSHCSSIGNALMKHDLKVLREDRATAMAKRIQAMQDRRDEQKSIIKKYVAQRQKVIQAESNAERTEIELKIMQENKMRREETKQRVSALKKKKTVYKELYPVPLHIHVGSRAEPKNLHDSSYFPGSQTAPPKSPLARLAEKKILTNKSYDVIQQRVRSAGSGPMTPAVVHIQLK